MASIDLVGLSKPATALINKISDAIGVVYEPHHVRRLAKAKADAAVVAAEAEVRITDVHRRAVRRWIDEEAQKQLNIESLTEKAIARLAEDADPGSMGRDWIANFFDKSRLVTDEDMQDVWSSILAREASKPGTFSRKTLNVVGDLDRTDAELFTTLCGFCWTDVTEIDFFPLVLDERDDIYARHGISFTSLSSLESLGLLSYQASGYRYSQLNNDMLYLGYFGDYRAVDLGRKGNHQLDIGRILLTKAEKELLPICGRVPIEGLLKYIEEKWSEYGMEPIQVARGTLVIP